VVTLGVTESTSSIILSVAYVTFSLFPILSRFVATRFGRKRTIIVGLMVFATLLAVVFFTPTAPAIAGLLAVGGVAWSPVNVNSLPMMVDASPSETSLGTYTGLW